MEAAGFDSPDGCLLPATEVCLAPTSMSAQNIAMKRILAAALISMAASDALAVERFEISNVTCETVQALLRTEGSVILVYRSRGILGLPIYDRYVLGQQNCNPGEVARGAGVPTVDKDYCPVRKCVTSQIFTTR